MKTTINERINDIVTKFYSGKQALFAKKIGYSPSRVNGWCLGTYEPKFETIARIMEEHPQININWFILGSGEMLDIVGNSYRINEINSICAEPNKQIEEYKEKVEQLKRQIEKLEADKERLWNLVENNKK